MSYGGITGRQYADLMAADKTESQRRVCEAAKVWDDLIAVGDKAAALQAAHELRRLVGIMRSMGG